MRAAWPAAGRFNLKLGFLLAAALPVLGFALREHWLPAVGFALYSLWGVLPIMLAGSMVTAALTATGAMGLLAANFKAREVPAIAWVSIVGAVLPVCGITLLPLVAGLLGAGVALAPVMAFLLSSAVTDPSMFAITAATLGLPLAVAKTIAAFGIGVFGGGVTWALVRAGSLTSPLRRSPGLPLLDPGLGCGPVTEDGVHWRFWEDPGRLALFSRTCLNMIKLVSVLLSVAFVAEYFLRLYLPDDALVGLVGRDNPLAIPTAVLVAAPLYLDGYAALPLVRGLLTLGMSEGAALAFLIAGGIISAWTALPVLALLRLPVFVAYTVMALVGSMLAGWAYGVVVA